MARLTKNVLVRNPENGDPVSLREGQEAPEWYTNSANLDGVQESGSDSEYADWKVSELKQEIEDRNLLRPEDDQLPLDGKKADLIAVLEQDNQE